MTKKIIVAGSGVGGLLVGALLSKEGFDVTLYSLGTPDTLGYDWTDSLDKNLLEKIIGKAIPKEDFCYDDVVAFYTPSEKIKISNAGEGERTTTKMERRTFERYAYSFAVESGVKFVWETRVNQPIVENGRVVGIVTDKGEARADLVIDACGAASAIRHNLPDDFNIEKDYAYGDVFHVCRAMFKRNILGAKPDCPLEIYLLHLGEKGIAWYCTRDDEIDVLIGRFSPVPSETVVKTLDVFKQKHPELVDKIKRGSTSARFIIPVRRPLNKFVADGYAAIGDSAFMTLPMNGSGINFTMNAALILAATVQNAKDYTTAELWNYQYEYYVKFGKNLAGVEAIKNTLLGMNPKWVDFLFENRIITQKEMDSEEGMSLSFGEILGKAVRGMKNPLALIALVKGLAANGALTKHYAALPESYSSAAFAAWNSKTDKLVRKTALKK